MKKILLVLVVAIALVVATTSVAFAAEPGGTGRGYGNGYVNNPGSAPYCAQLTPDQLEQFKADRLARYKERLDAAVAGGSITREQADEFYAAKKMAMDNCDGSGSARGQGGVCINGNGAAGTCDGTGTRGRGCGMYS